MFGSARNSFRNTPLPGTIDFQSRFPKVDFHESRLDGIKIDRIDEFNFGKMYRAELSGRTRTWTRDFDLGISKSRTSNPGTECKPEKAVPSIVMLGHFR